MLRTATKNQSFVQRAATFKPSRTKGPASDSRLPFNGTCSLWRFSFSDKASGPLAANKHGKGNPHDSAYRRAATTVIEASREEVGRLSRHLQELPVHEDLRSGSASAPRPTRPPKIPPAARCPSRLPRRLDAADHSDESLRLQGPTKTCKCIRPSCTASRIPLASPR